MRNVSKEKVLSVSLPLSPKLEQSRIVQKLSEIESDLDVAAEALNRIREKVKRYRASVLKAAVEGRLTEEWRAKHSDVQAGAELLQSILTDRRRKWEEEQVTRNGHAENGMGKNWRDKYREPARPDESTLPALPNGWCWATVEQIGDVQLGRQRSPKNRAKKFPTKYLRAANLTWDGLDLTNILEMEFKPHERESYELKKGDLLLSEASGSADEVGKPAVWNDELEGCCFQNTVIRVRPSNLPSAYLLVAFLHFARNKVFARVAKGIGIHHLGGERLAAMPIPIPPLEEQHAIALEVERRVSVVCKVEAEIAKNSTRAVALRQAILRRAFEGNLLPQVVTDEPASEILERIRKEKLAREATAHHEDSRGQTPKRKESREVFFRRGSVVAYVVRRLTAHSSFGRTQLEKILHISQSHLEIDLGLQFKRYAAGPFDEAIYKLEAVAKKQGWFKTEQRKKFGVTYHPGPKTEELCQSAITFLGDKRAALDQLLGHVEGMDTDQAELLATIYAAWNDLLIDGRAVDDEAIIAEVYGWDESKKKFDRERILARRDWMVKNGYVPEGRGQRTVVRSKKTKLTSQRHRSSR